MRQHKIDCLKLIACTYVEKLLIFFTTAVKLFRHFLLTRYPGVILPIPLKITGRNKCIEINFFRQRSRLRVVPHFSSGIVERAKR